MLTTIAFILTADTAPLENAHQLQRTSMRRCYEPSTYEAFSHRFRRLVPNKKIDIFNECNLNGVTCEEQIVKRIKLNARQYLINAHWMPSSTEMVHLTHTSLLNGWRPETLPKSLKYLYMRECQSLPLLVDVDREAAVNAGREVSGETNLCNLPRNLEEMYAINSGYAGGLCIQGLPRSLRVLVLKDRWSDAFIDFDEMSEGLEHILIDTMFLYKNIKVFPIGEQKRDSRVKCPYADWDLTAVLRESAYIRQFDSATKRNCL